MTSQKCSECNNVTTNPSGMCHVHEGRASRSSGPTGTVNQSLAVPSMDGGDSPQKRQAQKELNTAKEHYEETKSKVYQKMNILASEEAGEKGLRDLNSDDPRQKKKHERKIEKIRKKIAKEYNGDMSTWDEWSENPAVVSMHRVERHPKTLEAEKKLEEAQIALDAFNRKGK